jgi:phosphoribosyl 1,2-cyclic phosphodiesterase
MEEAMKISVEHVGQTLIVEHDYQNISAKVLSIHPERGAFMMDCLTKRFFYARHSVYVCSNTNYIAVNYKKGIVKLSPKQPKTKTKKPPMTKEQLISKLSAMSPTQLEAFMAKLESK